jgi:hypothetical protein
LLGLKEVVPPTPARKYTVEKWSGGSLRVVEMSDDRVKEARDVNTNTKPIATPAQPPAAAPTNDAFSTSYVPSGVAVPVDLGEEQ